MNKWHGSIVPTAFEDLTYQYHMITSIFDRMALTFEICETIAENWHPRAPALIRYGVPFVRSPTSEAL